MKKSINREAHVPNTKHGHGEMMGTAISNKMGRSIDVFGVNTKPLKQSKTSKPISLA